MARGAQVEAPDAQTLDPGEPLGLLEVLVEAVVPGPQRVSVVALEAFDVLRVEARVLERELRA